MTLNDQIEVLATGIEQLIRTTRPNPPAEASAAADASPPCRVEQATPEAMTLTIRGQSVRLDAGQLSALIEELAHARAAMTVEQPTSLPAGWRFVATKNPLLAVQAQPNGDRLLLARHTGYGWVPFTLSPDQIIQLYLLLTQQ